ncbi:hypothetical protein [Pseudomonas citronellolis]|uniref:hypothetical protein n=1 Tax=Pseudomonas citronellolis TaxID=53408 RepID=UPI000778EA07|nr:hypothetical protein [Pseudomonas citronellolis]AMO73853.1 hypothetical protein PcP3B5_03410 [Pseudomonas citronellolis]
MASNTSRTSAQMVEDLRVLTGGSSAQSKQLEALEPRGALAAKRGRADYQAPAAATGGGGIASPLKEEDASKREYYEDQLIPSTDGLAWLRLKSVKKLVMKDGDGAEVVMEFANGLSE